tara:strand:- start:9490 stop:10818 length:1329 start_codon:yes stop_codon:yes gene_type:complete
MKKRTRQKISMGDICIRETRGPNNNGLFYWRAEWYLKGELGKQSVKSLGWLTRQRAIEAGSELLRSGAHLRRPSVLDHYEASETLVTVEDLMQTWMAYQSKRPRRECSENHLNAMKYATKRILGSPEKPALRNKPIKMLTDHNQMASWTWSYDGPRRSVNTLHQDYKTLRAAFRWASDNRYIDLGVNQFCRLQLPALPSPDKEDYINNHHTPTNNECEEVYRYLKAQTLRENARPQISPSASAAVFLTLWSTGARVSEVVGLTWGDIDLRDLDERGTRGTRRTILFKKTKTKVVRRVLMSVRLQKELSDLRSQMDPRQLRDDAPIFLSSSESSKAVSRRAVHNKIQRACKELGIETFSAHGLRRLAADTMCRRGAKAESAAKILGHSVEMMMKIYRTISVQELDEAMELANLGMPDSEYPAATSVGGAVLELVPKTAAGSHP